MKIVDAFFTRKISSLWEALDLSHDTRLLSPLSLAVPSHLIFGNPSSVPLSSDGYMKFSSPDPLAFPWRRRLWAGSSWEVTGSDADIKAASVDGTGLCVSWRHVSERIVKGACWSVIELLTASSTAAEVKLIKERRTLVYLDKVYEKNSLLKASPYSLDTAGSDFQKEWSASPSCLAAYSTLTCNNHKIHLDSAYASSIEGYPGKLKSFHLKLPTYLSTLVGLVVHGSVVATVLLHYFRIYYGMPPVKKYEFRALAPLFANEKILCKGTREGRLWAERVSDGQIVTQAQATIN